MRGLVLLASLICLESSWANDVDLRALFPRIRDQGAVGNCYAQTSSDLITAYLKSRNPEIFKDRQDSFVSPTAISFCSKYSELNKEFNETQKRREIFNDPDYSNKMDEIKTLANQIRQEIAKIGLPNYERDKLNQLETGFEALCKQLNLTMDKCESHFLWPKPDIDPYGGMGQNILEYKSNSLDAGYIKDSITNALAQCGVCFQSNYGKSDQELVQSFDSLLDKYASNSIDISGEQCGFESLSTLAPNNYQNFKDVLLELQKNELKEHPAISLFKKNCLPIPETNNFEEKMKHEWLEEKDWKVTSKKISNLINSGVPVGISYYASILKADGNAQKHANHASTIVGQKKIRGKLYFILRNSWGSEACSKELERAKMLSVKVKFKCDEGDYILEAKDLVRVTYGVTYIKK
jgi:hypothetical protein